MPTTEELARLAETHELMTLTDEEDRMLYAFRLFKDKKHKAGAVFTWQTRPDSEGGALPSQIITPAQNRAEFNRRMGGR